MLAASSPRHGAEIAASDAPLALARLRTFHTLDALRGVAALAIVLFHTGFLFPTEHPAEGQIAVDLFFVISGFIIAHRYDDDLRRGMTLRNFAALRLIRLYPLFLMGMVLGVVPAVVAVAAGLRDATHVGMVESFPLAVVMLPSRLAMPRMDEIYPLNYVAWSLTLEIVVNLAYAATHRAWTIRNLCVLLAVSFAGLCVCGWVYGTLHGGFSWSNVPIGLVRVLYGFGAGVLLCRLHERKAYSLRAPWWLLVVVTCAIFFVHPLWARAAWELFAVAVLVPMIVAAAVMNEPPRALLAPCAVAGVYSYVLYSLHVPLIGFYLRGESRAHFPMRTQTPGEVVFFVLVLVATCLVAHHCYDKPVRRFLSARLAAGRRSTALLQSQGKF